MIAAFYRMLFAGGLLLAWWLARRRRYAFGGRGVRLALGAGVCFGTDLALWHLSLVRSSVATSTLLVNTTPIHVGLFSVLVLRAPLHPAFAGGAALALLGCLWLLGVPARATDTLEGALLALAASAFYAGYLLLIAAARRGIETFPALLASTAAATAALGLYSLAGGLAFAGFPASSWAAMAALALVSQLGGVLGIVWSLRYLPATVASVALLAQPLGAAALGWLVLGEAIAPAQAAGGGAVLAGILLASRAAPARAGGEAAG